MPQNKIKKIISSVRRAFASIFALAKFEKVIGEDDPYATIKRINNMKRISVIVGLLILIVISIILPLRGCQGGGSPHGSVDIPGNVIDTLPPTAVSKADLEFNNTNAEENLQFNIEGMGGGSSATHLYRINATYNSDFVLKYDMTIREDEEFQKLAEVLKIKAKLVVGEDDTLLYDGLLADMPTLEMELNADTETIDEYIFRNTIYLDASIGEQYYGQKLIADMSWWIDEQDNISIANNECTTVSKSTGPDSPTITPNLKFSQINGGDNAPFHMKSIEDGYSQIKYFAFEVAHGEDIKMAVKNSVMLHSRLDEVLKVKLELVDDDGNITLYEGPLKDLSAEHTLPKNRTNKTTVYYKISVTADGLTDAYCGTKLVYDLSWSLCGTSEQLIVPNNTFVAYVNSYIPSTPSTATSIILSAKDGYDNIPFNITNMLPGDSAAQYYCICVTHDSTETVRFEVTVDTALKLSDVLRVKIEQLIPGMDNDRVLYDGLMKNCTAVDVSVTASTKTVTPIYYCITVYTNGSEVGNQYAGESLTADFSWQLQ